MIAGDPALQWEWHEAFRDQVKNMYRTSYSDMSHNREVYVKSDFPSGYGGHVPSVRHDVLHRNTAFDRKMALSRTDPSRDALPSFNDQIAGLPTSTKYPCGAKNNPTKGVVRHDGTTTMLKPPWGVMTGVREGLNQRNQPPTMRMQRTGSLPTLGSSQRVNQSAQNVGAFMARSSSQAQPLPPQAKPELTGCPPGAASPAARNSVDAHLRRTVMGANEDAKQGSFPTEAEILAEQMNMC